VNDIKWPANKDRNEKKQAAVPPELPVKKFALDSFWRN
jgi:hypothetical protein